MELNVTTDRSNINNQPVDVNIPVWNIRELYKTEDGYCFYIIGEKTRFYVNEKDGEMIKMYIMRMENYAFDIV